MAILRCKMCGGTLETDSTQSVAVCEYCGTKQTLPKLNDDRKVNLYDRAGHFRRNNEFDKALAIYEQILNEDNTDAESYWSIVLCRYGIEYVVDPATGKRVPTVNRAQFTSIFDDEDYKSAIKYADEHQKEIYEAEAHTINEIQKGILAISQKEEPFDIFICYKESDANGRRTQDSVLATELYNELTRDGFKVFFARITLEDKLGIAYEPYIFAALNSSKVMVVIGTKPEYFNAVWVKNEWSRYLALIKSGAKKMLIPAYRDMDPYDLPEEFSHLQAQDMSKLGFMQDLTRGIKKILGKDKPKSEAVKQTVAATPTSTTAPLLRRAALFLEDGDFGRADDLCEQVLNQDPENGEAYLYKLMVEMSVRKRSELAFCEHSFDHSDNYKKIIRFADEKVIEEVRGYLKDIEIAEQAREEEARKQYVYNQAKRDYNSYDISRITKAKEAFQSIPDFKDSETQIRLCENKINALTEKMEEEKREQDRLLKEKQRLAKKAQTKKRIRRFVWAIIIIGLLVAIPWACYTYVIPEACLSSGNYATYINLYKITDFEVPEGVTEIPDYAFNGCETLESVTLPDSVESIGNAAFYGCTSLREIEIPESVTFIGDEAFYDCSSLKSISIPHGVAILNYKVFSGCESLKSVTLSAGVLSVFDTAFRGCNKIANVYYTSSSSDYYDIIGIENVSEFENAEIHFNAAYK